MAQANKFGTFGGVFTPSILTILGVIMYLRLGWVVGQAGLIAAIAIILIAHVISITTGLSVSSVATDKKVKAGGLYYMLSRSLGLPIGGSIGIALYVATALSISLYIVGFSESFNSVVGFTTEDTTSTEAILKLRITGTITLLIITSVALISTSLAIKTQYYIMGAIFLSIVSIVAGGFFMDTTFQAQKASLAVFNNGVQLERVFEIFFPAVTGFTAGVAMSGDLKDPKKSIPTGTMAAIFVGLVVYLGLTVFLSVFVEREYLVDDYNVLSKISLFAVYGSPLVVSGIWGATLSSALGGILGGPRILQAMSVDKITWKIFAKGKGKDNEPRNALIVTFIIAEVGVLIGQLDVIAPIVSMFYLTAYGFINLTSALESWSGSDFRPQFKIPRWVSIIGALATFGVMFKLNTAAMFGAFLIIAILFFFLTKKQINLGFSNIWQGVYAEIVRRSLFKIGKRESDQRNWRPNILLFSGAANQREYLVDFGSKLVGRLGLISNFNVVESKEGQVIPKSEQMVGVRGKENGQEAYRGVFARQYYHKNVYEGMANIAETYGFSGIEPNTILIGWARGQRAENEFVPLLYKLKQLDINLLVMDYEKQRKFGNRQSIDIWWEGTGRNLSFILTMIRFLTSTDEWLNADIRMIVHTSSIDTDGNELLRNLNNLMEEFRLAIEIKTINTLLDSRPLYELIKSESAETDLIFTELPDIDKVENELFYQQTTKLCNETGTIVLYNGSSEFKDIQVGITPISDVIEPDPIPLATDELSEEVDSQLNFNSFELPENETLSKWVEELQERVENTTSTYYSEYLSELHKLQDKFNLAIIALFQKTETQLKNRFKRRGSQGKIKVLEIHTQFLEEFKKLVYQFRDNDLVAIKKKLELGCQMFSGEISYLNRTHASKTAVKYDYRNLKDYRRDLLKNFNFIEIAWANLFDQPLSVVVDFDKISQFYIYRQFIQNQHQLAGKITADYFKFIALLQKNLNVYFQKLNLIEKRFNEKDFTFSKALEELKQVYDKHDSLRNDLKAELAGYHDFLQNETIRDLSKLSNNLDKLQISKNYYSQKKGLKSAKNKFEQWLDFPQVFEKNLKLYINFFNLDVSMKLLQNSIRERMTHYNQTVSDKVQQSAVLTLKQVQSKLRKLKLQLEKDEEITELIPPDTTVFAENGDFDYLLNDLKALTGSLPYELLTLEQEAMNNPAPDKLEEIASMSFSPSVVANYHLQTSLIEPLIAEMQTVRETTRKSTILIKDVIRLINFGVENILTQEDLVELHNAKQELLKLLNEENKRLRLLIADIKKTTNTYIGNTDKLVSALADKFNAYNMVKSSANIGFNLRSRSREKALSKVTDLVKVSKDKSVESLTQLIYRRSEGLLAARKLGGLQPKKALVEELLNLYEKTTPDPATLKLLPYYYKQLFLTEHLSGDELWFGRKKQLEQGRKAITRFKEKQTGALLVMGMPQSGKSFLADYLAHEHFEKEKIYRIDPPIEGSTDPEDFRNAIAKKLKISTSSDSFFRQASSSAVFIFEDFERWWMRTPSGYQVVHTLIDMIDRYSHTHLFVVLINPVTYRFINQSVKLEDSFIQIIDCEPFDAKSLKDIILLRHQSSGMKFRIGEHREDKISKWKLAQLFSALFDASYGNIGTALQTWISSMKNVEDNVLEIEVPKLPSIDILRKLPSSWTVILIQLMLHRKLSIAKLDLIMNHTVVQLHHELTVLKRSGLIEEERGMLKINRYLEHLLIQVFTEDGIL